MTVTEEKLYTIDELMEGKAPGSVKIVRQHSLQHTAIFCPYFKTCEGWHGVNEEGTQAIWRDNGWFWKLYTEPKKKKVLRPAILRFPITGRFQLSMALYESAEHALKSEDPDYFICLAPDSYAVEVEVEE